MTSLNILFFCTSSISSLVRKLNEFQKTNVQALINLNERKLELK